MLHVSTGAPSLGYFYFRRVAAIWLLQVSQFL